MRGTTTFKVLQDLFNGLIWNLCPKTEFCSADVVEIAVNLAILTFNSGEVIILDRCSFLTYQFLSSTDENRIWLDDWKTKEVVKK